MLSWQYFKIGTLGCYLPGQLPACAVVSASYFYSVTSNDWGAKSKLKQELVALMTKPIA